MQIIGHEYALNPPPPKLIRIDEDVYELQLHVLVTFELPHSLGLGAAIEVIAPESLRQRANGAPSVLTVPINLFSAP